MTEAENIRLLAIRAAYAGRGLEAAELGVAQAEEVAGWLSTEDWELRCACMEEALKHRTGGSRVQGLLAHAKALYVFVKAGAPTPPAKAVPKGSRRVAPREVRPTDG